ncbi:MAG: ABC transporter permease [Geminicoccaceae bacterium]
MGAMIVRRLGLGLLTLLVVSAIIFATTEILPGDVATAILGQSATPEAVANIRADLGLDRPAILRYGEWLSGFLHGDLGTSLASRQPVATQLLRRLGNTMFLAGFAAVIAVPLAVGLGLLAAVKRETPLDKAISIATLSTISVPEFFVGYILIILLAVQFPIFPSLATVSADMPLATRLYAVALPALTLTLVVLAHMMRMTRAAVIDVLSQPYIEMARLKGLPDWRVVLEHALPNALGPIITVVALNLAYLVVGVVVVEVVFVYPGMGQYMVDAVSKRDVPVVQACTLIFALTYVGLNLLADVLGIMVNPRLRHPR